MSTGVTSPTDNPRISREASLIESPVSLILAPGAMAAPPTEPPSELRILLQALRAELQHLTRQIDKTWADRADSVDVERAATQVVDVAAHLPDRIVGALSAALETQHRTIMADVQRVIAERMPETTVTEMIGQFQAQVTVQLDQLHARFDQRLDTLGDRLEQLVMADADIELRDPVVEQRNAAILVEVEQLRRVVAGTLDLLGERQQAG